MYLTIIKYCPKFRPIFLHNQKTSLLQTGSSIIAFCSVQLIQVTQRKINQVIWVTQPSWNTDTYVHRIKDSYI